MKKVVYILALLIVVGAGGWFYASVGTSKNANLNHQKQAIKPQAKSKPTFNKNLYSHTLASSIWVVVNKLNPLNPKDYVPADLVVPSVPLRVPGNQTMQLRRVAAVAMEQMFAAAKGQGINLMLASGYRSYSYQTTLYNGYVATQGQAVADAQSARPGYSEHQTGLAADVEPLSRNCEVEQCFATTPEGIWLAKNSYKFGFIIRYPQNGQNITGYEYEPWHIRYIGIPAATEMHNEGVTTLEQFFGYPPAPHYATN
jgi:D-alanyl-D-alanine carboxypeptidase